MCGMGWNTVNTSEMNSSCYLRRMRIYAYILPVLYTFTHINVCAYTVRMLYIYCAHVIYMREHGIHMHEYTCICVQALMVFVSHFLEI